MPQKDIKTRIINVSLELAQEKGWAQTSLSDIAERAELSLAELHEHVEDKCDVLTILGRMIDRKVLAEVGKTDTESSPRDRLFDILMERYDALNEYRDGLCAVLDSFSCDPKQAIIGLPHLARSMTWMLEAAGIETTGIRGAVRVTGLMAVYLKGLYCWKKDDSPDLAKTMAALDKALGRAEYVASLTGL